MLIVTILLGALASAAPRGAESAPAPSGLDRAYARRVALVVGVDHYPADDAIDDLRFAAKDASDVGAVLSDPRWGDFDETVELTGTVDRETFWSVLSDTTAEIGPQDTFVLYFAGHGSLDLTATGTQLYLIPSDGELSSPSSTGISLTAVEDAVAALPARQRVVMVDACHSVTVDARASLSPETRAHLSRLRGAVPSPTPRDVSTSEVYLYAAAHNQPAQEDDALRNGVYTHFLLRALRGEADLDSDGLIEVMELHDWVSARTEEHTGGLQIPQIQAHTVGREVIFLSGDAHRRAEAEASYRQRLAELQASEARRTRGLSVTVSQDGWLRHGPQVGYAHRFVTEQHAAQAEALGAPIPTHLATVGYALRQQPGARDIRPLLQQDVALTGAAGSLQPQLGALAGVSYRRRVSVAGGARWSPEEGLRPIAAVGSASRWGSADVPTWIVVDAGTAAYWGISLTVGTGWLIR